MKALFLQIAEEAKQTEEAFLSSNAGRKERFLSFSCK
jgi:hypothetical protein